MHCSGLISHSVTEGSLNWCRIRLLTAAIAFRVLIAHNNCKLRRRLMAWVCMVQVGMPADQAQYIHRVGRTARAGKQGQALLLLHDFERFFLRHIAELPVTQIQPTPVEVMSQLKPCPQVRLVPSRCWHLCRMVPQ